MKRNKLTYESLVYKQTNRGFYRVYSRLRNKCNWCKYLSHCAMDRDRIRINASTFYPAFYVSMNRCEKRWNGCVQFGAREICSAQRWAKLKTSKKKRFQTLKRWVPLIGIGLKFKADGEGYWHLQTEVVLLQKSSPFFERGCLFYHIFEFVNKPQIYELPNESLSLIIIIF